MLSLRQLAEAGVRYLPPGLAASVTADRLPPVPSYLPPIFTQGTFECRLDDDARIDFQACAPRGFGAHALIRRWLKQASDVVLPSRGHRSTAALLREWVEPRSILGDEIAAVWVEIDADDSEEPPWPFPLFTLTPPWVRSEPRTADRTKALVDAGLRVLTGGNLDPRTHCTVHACLDALPPQASLFHVAMRPMPGGDVVRLIAGTPWHLVPEFLAKLDWPEPVEQVRHFLQRYCQDTLINSIQLDLGHRLGPRLGLEVYYPTAPEDPRWQRLFDLLVADGSCTPERRDLVCAWPMRSPAADLVLRNLLVKVVYEVGKAPRAKAYLPYGLAKQPADVDHAAVA